MENTTDTMINGSEKTGYYFGDIAEIRSPKEAIEAAIACIGTLFACDRVYIFKKNPDGNYDCIDEWCGEGIFPKKDLMQNLAPNTVRHYYRYFQQAGQLSLKDIEMIRTSDEELYNILKYQELKSVFVTQLVYDEKDLGFIGLDNPGAEKFHELDPIMHIIRYFIAIQMHNAEMNRKLESSTEITPARDGTKRSLYDRVEEMRLGDSFGLVSFQIDLPESDHEDNYDLQQRIIRNSNRVLDSIFKSKNVYSLGFNEFLIIYEDSAEQDLLNLKHYVETALRTLESINIHAVIGAVKENHYQGNFYELVTKADEKILQEKRKYKEMQLSKYHIPSSENVFTGLFEVQVALSKYKVLYSETLTYPSLEGDVADLLSFFENKVVHEKDRKAFRDFWEDVFRRVGDPDVDFIRQNFRIYRENHAVSNVSVDVTSYHDVDGNLVILATTY